MNVHPLFGPLPELRYHVYATWLDVPALWGPPHAELAEAKDACDFTVSDQGAERAVVLDDAGVCRHTRLAPAGRAPRPRPEPARSRPSALGG